MAPPPKSRRQRAGRSRPSVPVSAVAPKVPPPRAEWYAEIKKKWRTFWTSDAARVLAVAVDVGAAERLFDLYDERERAYRRFRKERFVDGSQGQKVLNPLGRLITSFDSEIRQLEDRLGFSPVSRMRLGIEITPIEPPAPSSRRSSRSRPDPRLSKDAAK